MRFKQELICIKSGSKFFSLRRLRVAPDLSVEDVDVVLDTNGRVRDHRDGFASSPRPLPEGHESHAQRCASLSSYSLSRAGRVVDRLDRSHGLGAHRGDSRRHHYLTASKRDRASDGSSIRESTRVDADTRSLFDVRVEGASDGVSRLFPRERRAVSQREPSADHEERDRHDRDDLPRATPRANPRDVRQLASVESDLAPLDRRRQVRRRRTRRRTRARTVASRSKT